MIAIFQYCANKWLYGFGMVLLIIAAGLGLLVPLQVKVVFDEIATGHLMLSRFLPLLGLFTLTILLTTVGNYLLGAIGEKTVCVLRQRLIKRFSYLENIESGDKKDEEEANHITNDTEIISDVLTTTLPTLVTGTLTWFGSIVMLFVIDAYLTLFILICASILFLIIKHIGIRLKEISENFRSHLAAVNASLIQLIRFSLDIKINDPRDWFIGRILDKNQALYRLSLKGLKYRMILIPIVNMVLLIMMVTVIGIGIYRTEEKLITIGSLVSFLIYLYQLVPVTLSLSTTVTNLSAQQGGLSFVLNRLRRHSSSKMTYPKRTSNVLSPSDIRGENLALA